MYAEWRNVSMKSCTAYDTFWPRGNTWWDYTWSIRHVRIYVLLFLDYSLPVIEF